MDRSPLAMKSARTRENRIVRSSIDKTNLVSVDWQTGLLPNERDIDRIRIQVIIFDGEVAWWIECG